MDNNSVPVEVAADESKEELDEEFDRAVRIALRS